MASAVREAVVAQAPPTAPRAGRPNVPGTSNRSTIRLTTLAIHIIAMAGLGRPSPSSHDEPATDRAVAGRAREKTISGREAPAARSADRPAWRRNRGPA